MLAKMFAMRLEKVLPSIISSDHTGFVKKLLLFSNLHRLYNILDSPGLAPQHAEVLVSLDAEKAFDRVEWDFLFAVLKKFELGDNFITWVKLLYQSKSTKLPKAFYTHTSHLK